MRFLTLGFLLFLWGQLAAQDKIFYYDPVWSPDGRIAFYSNLKGNYDIYIVDKDGSNLRQITSHEASDAGPAFSASGDRLVFSSKRNGNNDIYTYNLGTKEIKQITNTPENESSARLSPDGKWIVFESKRDGPRDVYISRSDGTDIKNLTQNEANDFRPIWSRDGKLIFFQSKRSGTYQLYSMKPDGSEVILLYKSTHHQTTPAPFFSSNKLAYAQYSDNGVDIHVLNLDTRQVEAITDGNRDVFLPSFSPDGAEIVFATTKADGSSSDLFIMDYKTRKVRKLLK